MDVATFPYQCTVYPMNYTHRFLVFCLVVVISSAHYGDVIMDTMASQITSHTIVYPTVYSDTDQRKHQSSAPLAFVWGIHRWKRWKYTDADENEKHEKYTQIYVVMPSYVHKYRCTRIRLHTHASTRNHSHIYEWIDYRGIGEVTRKDMGKTGMYQTTTKHNKAWIMCMIIGYTQIINMFGAPFTKID